MSRYDELRTYRDRRAANPARHRAFLDKRSVKEKAARVALRLEILAAYGSACACCGETTQEFLSIDHVNGGGRAERKKIGSAGLMLKIKRDGFPPEYRILCHNCNMARAIHGECPHTRS